MPKQDYVLNLLETLSAADIIEYGFSWQATEFFELIRIKLQNAEPLSILEVLLLDVLLDQIPLNNVSSFQVA